MVKNLEKNLKSVPCYMNSMRFLQRRNISIRKVGSIACCLTTVLVLQTGCSQSDTSSQSSLLVSSNSSTVSSKDAKAKNGTGRTHVVRVAVDSQGMQVDELSEKDIDFYASGCCYFRNDCVYNGTCRI